MTKKTLLCILLAVSTNALLPAAEIELNVRHIPGLIILAEDSDGNSMWICRGKSIGPELRFNRFIWKPSDKTAAGISASAGLDFFDSAEAIENAKAFSCTTIGTGLSAFGSVGAALQILTDSGESLSLASGARLSMAFAELGYKGSDAPTTFLTADTGLFIDAAYRLWIPSGRFGLQMGARIYWGLAGKNNFADSKERIYSNIEASIFAGICMRSNNRLPKKPLDSP